MAKAAVYADESEWQKILQDPSSKSLTDTDVCYDWDPCAEGTADYSDLVDEFFEPGSYSSAPVDAAYCQDTTLADQSMGQPVFLITSFKFPSAQHMGNVARGQSNSSYQTAFGSKDAVLDEPVSQRPYNPVTLSGPAILPNVAGANISERVDKLQLELENNKEMVRKMKAFVLALVPWINDTHVMTDDMWDWQRLTELAWNFTTDTNDTVPVKQKSQQLGRIRPQWVEKEVSRE